MHSKFLRLLAVVLCSCSFISHSTAEEARFLFGTSDDWRGERIALPPGFARDMEWVGEEDIRFAPGMFKADSDNFFTYVLVFLLDKEADVSPESIHQEVLKYYRGLSKTVMRNPQLDTSAFKLHLVEDKAPAQPPAQASEVKQFSGTLDWIEPFTTKKAQQLHLELQLWSHHEQPALFLCVSPRAPEQEIWKELRKIRSGFTIE
jgi:hypothetical protein